MSDQYEDQFIYWGCAVSRDENNEIQVDYDIFNAIDEEDARQYITNTFENSECLFVMNKQSLEKMIDVLLVNPSLDERVEAHQQRKYLEAVKSWDASNIYHVSGYSKNTGDVELIVRADSQADSVVAVGEVYPGFVPYFSIPLSVLLDVRESMKNI